MSLTEIRSWRSSVKEIDLEDGICLTNFGADFLIARWTTDLHRRQPRTEAAVFSGCKSWGKTKPVICNVTCICAFLWLHMQICTRQPIIYSKCGCNCMISKSGDHKITDVLNLCFRNKTGILGWRSEKTETVNGYEAKVRNTDPSHYPEKPPLSELSLIFPESPLHLKSSISKKSHSQGYYKNILK